MERLTAITADLLDDVGQLGLWKPLAEQRQRRFAVHQQPSGGEVAPAQHRTVCGGDRLVHEVTAKAASCQVHGGLDHPVEREATEPAVRLDQTSHRAGYAYCEVTDRVGVVFDRPGAE